MLPGNLPPVQVHELANSFTTQHSFISPDKNRSVIYIGESRCGRYLNLKCLMASSVLALTWGFELSCCSE